MTTEMIEDAAAYAEQKKVFQLFETLLADLVVHKPDMPIDHLIKKLKHDDVPKIVVAGPPGAQARSLCELLAAKSELVHVIASDVWRQLASVGSASGLKAKALVDKGEDVPSDLLLEMLKEKLSLGECVTKGWILEGFPSDPAQARSMVAAGLLPTRFVHIGVDDAEVVRRLAGRRVDPKENTVYHLEDAPPPNDEVKARLVHRADDARDRVVERLNQYRRAMSGVLPCFKKVTATALIAPIAHRSLWDVVHARDARRDATRARQRLCATFSPLKRAPQAAPGCPPLPPDTPARPSNLG
jgi:adenylate kinase